MNIDPRVIELSELRIGNLLEYKGELVKVTSLSCDIDDEYEDQICFVRFGTSTNEKGGWNRSLVNDLKRIPLTPELLERCGFESDKHGRWTGPQFETGNTIQWFEIEEDKKKGFYWLRGSEWVMGRPFQFLHQLQNLYNSLTGEELTIKEAV
jgi:hypothetical protein